MYISEQNRIGFIAVPRTGSTTVAHVLRSCCPDLRRVGPIALEGHHAVSTHPVDFPDGMRVVAFHRHPFARLFSDYRRASMMLPGKDTRAGWEPKYRSFLHYLKAVRAAVDDSRKNRDRGYRMSKRPLCVSATLWMELAQPAGVISWHPFARLLETIRGWPFVPPGMEIPHLKQSDATAEAMVEAFDNAKARRLAFQLHAEDFERWGYDPDPVMAVEAETETDAGLPLRETVLDDAAADELEQLLDGTDGGNDGNT